MPELDLNDTELAAGAAVAMDMAREDRKDNKHIKDTQPSSKAALIAFLFVAFTSIGMLVLMLALDK